MTARLIEFTGQGPVFTATVEVDGEVRDLRTAKPRAEFEKDVATYNAQQQEAE